MKKIWSFIIIALSIICLASCSLKKTKPAKTNYFDYNGKLHVSGNQIVNQYNESIQLNGVNCPIATNCHLLWRNLDKFDLLKEYGFNFVRIGLSTAREYTDDVMETYYGVLDHLIELGMYAEVISFNDRTIITNEEGFNKTKYFLTTIANRYKDNDNFIYCVGNEPAEIVEGSKQYITMSMIDEYSKPIMNSILDIKKDAIIAIPTPYACSEVDDCLNSTIDYKNTIYVAHCYLSKNEPNYNIYRRIETAVTAGKAIYLSEWSASSPSASDQYINTNDAQNTAYLINKYNLANAYYNYFPGGDTLDDNSAINPMGMVKGYWWNDRYREEDALTIGGKFITNLLKKPVTKLYGVTDKENYTIINNGLNKQYRFWNANISDKVKRIIFKDSYEIPNNFIDLWNLSETGLGNVYAYTIQNGEYYDLIFTSKQKIIFPENSSYLFYKFKEVESIEFNNIDTSNVTSMKGMFSGCSKLKSINLDKFDTSKVTTMHSMFNGTSSLESLDLSSFDTSKVTNTEYMFSTSSVKEVNFKKADFTKVTDYYAMFNGSNPKVIVKNEAARSFILNIKKLNVEIV